MSSEIELKLAVPPSAAARIAGLPWLRKLSGALANERAVRHGDPEGVHQMRVGLRRLRAAMSIFKEMLPGPETEGLTLNGLRSMRK
jgi:CHAD domain-containing protein